MILIASSKWPVLVRAGTGQSLNVYRSGESETGEFLGQVRVSFPILFQSGH